MSQVKLGRYAGSNLHMVGAMLAKTRQLAHAGVELSREARKRLQWMDWYRDHGENARLTCRHFGISQDTFYTWWRRYNPRDLGSLEARSSRPRRVRQPTWTAEQARAVLGLRERYPRWGKDKLAVLLEREGWQVSVSMVGRVLRHLKERGVLREPPRSGVAAQRRSRPRPYAVRKPKEYQPQGPGDLVQVDTLDVGPVPGVVLKHFTARDVVSRWDVVEVRTRATAHTAREFLGSLRQRAPFPVRAIQVDGGSEFQGVFEEACRELHLPLFVLPPRSPKLNGRVERAQRTHTEEFYAVYEGDLEVQPLNRGLREWERVYNWVRPHQALGYLTPAQFLARSATSPAPAKSRPKARQGASAARGP